MIEMVSGMEIGLDWKETLRAEAKGEGCKMKEKGGREGGKEEDSRTIEGVLDGTQCGTTLADKH